MEEGSLEPRTQALALERDPTVKKKDSLFAAVLLGQVVSLLIALTSLISALLASKVESHIQHITARHAAFF